MRATCTVGKESVGFKTKQVTQIFVEGNTYEVIPNGSLYYVISETGYKEMLTAGEFHSMFK